MPYIKQHTRKKLDYCIDELAACFKNNCPLDNGSANYIITRLILQMLKPTNGWSYESLSNVIKTLECSKLEITRRLLNNYEDQKIVENGDIPELYHFANLISHSQQQNPPSKPEPPQNIRIKDGQTIEKKTKIINKGENYAN